MQEIAKEEQKKDVLGLEWAHFLNRQLRIRVANSEAVIPGVVRDSRTGCGIKSRNRTENERRSLAPLEILQERGDALACDRSLHS